MGRKRYDPPPLEPSAGDAAYRVAHALASLVPAGGDLVEAVFIPPLLRRQQQWREDVAEAIRCIVDHLGIDPESLGENSAFVDTVLEATRIAIRNSGEVKLKALRATVINSPSRTAPEASVQQFFLHLVDEFTPWHLNVLRLFSDPVKWFQDESRSFPSRVSQSSLEDVLTAAFPELRGQRDFYDQVWRDLVSRGMVNTASLQGAMSPEGTRASRATDLGQQFVRFITAPDRNSDDQHAEEK